MQKDNPVLKIIDHCFNENLDFRVRIFNTLGLLGFGLGIFFGTFNIFVHPNILHVTANYSASLFAAYVIRRANKTKNFRRYFLITVIVVFFLIFPFLFFSGGGYRSGMPSFFIFAVVFTVIMIEGARRTLLTILEIALYLACFLIAWFRPETVDPFHTEADMAIDIIVSCLLSTIVLAIAIYQHIIVYDRKQKELQKANDALSGLNRMKTEFLQDIKHEIKNPLLVISLGTDSIHQFIDTGDGDERARNVLHTVQNEAVRLGRMINAMVEMATMSAVPTNRKRVDLSVLLNRSVETYRLQLEQKLNRLRVRTAPDLPLVYADAEQLERVPVNLLSNAINSTQNGDIMIEATAGNNYITVRVSDTGEGIHPDLFPRVFERGVSGKGGKGYGLSICKTIVEAHGGTIEIENKPDGGTAVTFTIPVYGGQSEARVHE